MHTFQDGIVTANDIQIHYLRREGTGQTIRPVIFLHGVTDNGRCWLRLARALPAEYDLSLLDSRSHGRSDAPASGYSAEDRADDVAGFIKAFKLPPAVVVGHAMGAETAMALAAVHPALTRAVILEDPHWPGRFYGSTPEERVERATHWREDILQQKAMDRATLIQMARESNPTWSDEDIDAWANAKAEMHPNLVGIVTAPRRRWTDYLRQATCPILLLTGDPEAGAIVSQRTVDEAGTIWRDGRQVHISGAGHNLRREQFNAYLAAITEFLGQIYV